MKLIKSFNPTREYRLDLRPIHLTWVTEGADKVWMIPPGMILPQRGMIRLYPKVTTNYTLYASSREHQESGELTIKVDLPDPEILYFYLEPAHATRGEMVKLHWKIIGAEKIELSFGRHRSSSMGAYAFRAFKDQRFTIDASANGKKAVRKEISLHVNPQSYRRRLERPAIIRELPTTEYEHVGSLEPGFSNNGLLPLPEINDLEEVTTLIPKMEDSPSPLEFFEKWSKTIFKK